MISISHLASSMSLQHIDVDPFHKNFIVDVDVVVIGVDMVVVVVVIVIFWSLSIISVANLYLLSPYSLLTTEEWRWSSQEINGNGWQILKWEALVKILDKWQKNGIFTHIHKSNRLWRQYRLVRFHLPCNGKYLIRRVEPGNWLAWVVFFIFIQQAAILICWLPIITYLCLCHSTTIFIESRNTNKVLSIIKYWKYCFNFEVVRGRLS